MIYPANKSSWIIKQPYIKPPLDHIAMVQLLKKRWLEIWDEGKVEKHLKHTGYYRLSAYFKSYQKKDDTFIQGTSFHDVWDTYIFDRKLRLHTLDAIEKIEVSLKANINDIFSIKKWCLWYLDPANFDLTPRVSYNPNAKQPFDIHKELMTKISNISGSPRENVKYYQQKYTPNELPSWILFDELTIGEISNMYNLFPQATRQEIADVYGVYERDFKAWIQTIMNIRNICAHHGRLWNRRYPFKVRANDIIFKSKFQKFKNKGWYMEVIPNYYNIFLIITHLLWKINKNFHWTDGLKNILKQHKHRYNKRMWLPARWYKNT